MSKRWFYIVLCMIFLMTSVIPIYGENEESDDYKIATVEDFVTFAEKCRLDSFSKNLKVSLEANIDMSDVEFEPIPIFQGIFEGNQHTVKGISLSKDGSVQGLFRYVTASAIVQNLSVEGEISPQGSANQIGGIVGINEGTVLNCSFHGNISGVNQIGGIAGTNTVTGVIENCESSGEIHGDHFIGGIAGENDGVIRTCINNANINITARQNDVHIADITIDTLTNSESADTVTDIGGISGLSTGVIRECINKGDVGYQHIGYNIGGIAGTQSGTIVDCINEGQILGRKEIGGIVGQMEPVSYIEYSQDTLQILQGQLETMSALTSQASTNAQNGASAVSGQIGTLMGQVEDARNAVGMLIDEVDMSDVELPDITLDDIKPPEIDLENPQLPEIDMETPQLPEVDASQLPNLDSIKAAQNSLSNSMSAMQSTLGSIASATQSLTGTLTRDLQAVTEQIGVMSDTISGASENLGGSVTDVSDLDTPNNLTGKVQTCVNYGNVLGDLHIGGIAGAMAMENDLDILDDWETIGEDSLNFQSEVRAVIVACKNQGTVTAKKQEAGGIVGWQPLGLVKNSLNIGNLSAKEAEYVGGVSGSSNGFIRKSYAKCEITGTAYVGGIAGSAETVSDCYAMVKIQDAKEKIGAILGMKAENTSQEKAISKNYYLVVDEDWGGMDGISYAGIARPVKKKTFFALENLPEEFQTVNIQFVFENGTKTILSMEPGANFDMSQIPEIPKKEGHYGIWEGLDEEELKNVLYDQTYEAMYHAYQSVLASERKDEAGRPLLLIEGAFTQDASIQMKQTTVSLELSQNESVVEAWNIQVNDEILVENGRYLIPDDVDQDRLRVYLNTGEESWEAVSVTVDGSYVTFPWKGKIRKIVIVEIQMKPVWLYSLIGIGVTVLLCVGNVIRKKKV